MLARQSPSSYKIRYLVHLEDCRSSCHRGVVHALSVLDSISVWFSIQQKDRLLWAAGKTLDDWKSDFKADLVFFREQSAEMESEITRLKRSLHEHLCLTHDRRNFTLTLLAAIFLPLSFVSTFFGMNIDNRSSASETGFSNWTIHWISNSAIEIQNSTRALASTTGTSGTLTFSWKTYTISATCLVFTLPLSLFFGSIMRTMYRSTAHYAAYWRGLAIVPSLVFVFFSIFGKYIFGWISITENIIICLYLLLRLHLASRKQQRRMFWICLLVVTAICTSLNVLVSYLPFPLFMWLFYALVWFWPWWKRRRWRKRQRQGEEPNRSQIVWN